jgi:hypothetical protein
VDRDRGRQPRAVGHYGSQISDCSANIDREMQQAAARDAVIALLHAVDRGGP